LAGSEGGSALDSLELHLVDNPFGSSIEYRVYTVSGWGVWTTNFQSASNRGEDILGVQIQLSHFEHANVYYQTYRLGLGWGTWVTNGATSGQLSADHPITGFRVQVDEVGVEYQSNVTGTLLPIRHNRETQGSGLIYTVNMGLISSSSGDSIQYRAYFKDSGWSGWVSDHTVLGNERAGNYITALEAKLVGLDGYHVGIQPQVNGEWWDYAFDGATAGTPGTALTAYRVKIDKDKEVKAEPVTPEVTTPVEETTFNFSSSSGSACFTATLPSYNDVNPSTYVGTIPSGITNIKVRLTTDNPDTDVDLELYDANTDSPIVLYEDPDTLFYTDYYPNAGYYSVDPYGEENLYIYYSGYNGYDGDHFGDEFIYIEGTTQTDLLIYILNYGNQEALTEVCYEYGEDVVIDYLSDTLTLDIVDMGVPSASGEIVLITVNTEPGLESIWVEASINGYDADNTLTNFQLSPFEIELIEGDPGIYEGQVTVGDDSPNPGTYISVDGGAYNATDRTIKVIYDNGDVYLEDSASIPDRAQ